MKTYKAVLFFLRFVGTRNYGIGIETPTVWQWLYKWRIGPKTAWRVAKLIWID